MSAIVHTALSVTPPVQEKNVAVFATTAASAPKMIPLTWRTGYLTVEADGDYVYIAFGPSTVAVDETAVTTFDAAGAEPTFQGDECSKVESGQTRDFDLRNLPTWATHFALKSSGTTGYVRLTRSSGGVGAQ